MEFMRSNQVWKLVNLSKWHKAIRNKWVLKIKCKTNGTIEKYKVKLVAKGYTQQEAINHDETFSPIVRFTSIHLILVIITSIEMNYIKWM